MLNNFKVKKTLKEHRTSKQLSQKELSEKSNISIRTIQRIEKNLSQGSPYIIKSLCNTLEIRVDELETDITKVEGLENSIQDELERLINETEIQKTRHAVKLINLSSITILLFPLLNLIIPSILYLKHKNILHNKVDALKIISFQFIWTILTLIIIIFIPAIIQVFFGMLEFSGFPLFIWIYLTCVFLNILIVLHIAISINKSERALARMPNIF